VIVLDDVLSDADLARFRQEWERIIRYPAPTFREEWVCGHCTSVNPMSAYKCANCGAPRTLEPCAPR